MLSPQFSNIRRVQFDQRSPVQPVSEIQKSKKISKNHFKKKLRKGKYLQKKCYPLIFPLLGRPDSTRALQFNPFQKYKNLKKSQKSLFSIFFFGEKKIAKKNAFLLVFQYQEDAIQPELSSPARFRFQGGQYERDGRRTKEILVSYIGYQLTQGASCTYCDKVF